MYAMSIWFDGWMTRTAISGSLVLLFGLVGMLLCRQPARRQRLGELALASALVAAVLATLPAWWQLDLGSEGKPEPVPILLHGEEPSPLEWFMPVETEASNPTIVSWTFANGEDALAATTTPMHAVGVATERVETSLGTWMTALALIYFGLILLLLGRCLLGYWALYRLRRQSRPAPARVRALFAELVPAGIPVPRLATSDRIDSPVSFGLRSPTILLPLQFCRPGQDSMLKSVLVHELTHLRRRDAWSCLLLALTQSVYFYIPWFWWLKRQVRLAQEFIADSAAARVFPAIDYAQFLVRHSVQIRPSPFAVEPANGVFQSPSDLSRRVEMLLKSSARIETTAPRGWTLMAASLFLSLAVLGTGVRLHADEQVAPAEENMLTIERAATVVLADDSDGELFYFSVAAAGDDEKPGPWIVTPQEREQLTRLQRALDALKATAKRLGDEVPPEVQDELRKVEQQLREASKRLEDRTAALRERGRAQAQEARKLAEKQAEAARAKAVEAFKAAEIRAQEVREQAEAQRIYAERLAAKVYEDAEQAKERVGATITLQISELKKEAEALTAEVKRRVQVVATPDLDEKQRLAEVDKLRALLQKTEAIKGRIRKLEQHAKQESAQPKQKEQEESSQGTQRMRFRVPPRPPVPPVPPAPPLPPSFEPGRFTVTRTVFEPRLGLFLEPVPEVLAHQLKLEDKKGLVVIRVPPNSPAQEQVKKFDILLEVDGKPFPTESHAIFRVLGQRKSGEEVKLLLLRDGQPVQVEGVRLGEAFLFRPGPNYWMPWGPGQKRGDDKSKEGAVLELRPAVRGNVLEIEAVKLPHADFLKLTPRVIEGNLQIEGKLHALPTEEKELKLPLMLEWIEKSETKLEGNVTLSPENKAVIRERLQQAKAKLELDVAEKANKIEVTPKVIIRGDADRNPDREVQVEVQVDRGEPRKDGAAETTTAVTVVPMRRESDSKESTRNVSVSISRNDGVVRARRQEGKETILILGSMEGEKLLLGKIEIDEGVRNADGKKVIRTFKSLDEVDAPIRVKVRKLMEAAESGKYSSADNDN